MSTDADRFGVAMLDMAASLDKEITDVMIEAYWGKLKDVPIATLEAACFDLGGSAKFWPKPVEIRAKTQESASRRADYTWGEVLSELRNCTRASHPDPVVEQIVRDLGGWLHLGRELAPRDLDFKAKDFRRMYVDAKQDEATRERLSGGTQRELTAGGEIP